MARSGHNSSLIVFRCYDTMYDNSYHWSCFRLEAPVENRLWIILRRRTMFTQRDDAVLFQICEEYKENSIHLHDSGKAADVPKSLPLPHTLLPRCRDDLQGHTHRKLLAAGTGCNSRLYQSALCDPVTVYTSPFPAFSHLPTCTTRLFCKDNSTASRT